MADEVTDKNETGKDLKDEGVDPENVIGKEGEVQGSSNEKGVSLESGDIPKELEPVRKSLLRDYHSKTQRLANERRQLESLRADSQKSAKDSETLGRLLSEPWFKKAYDTEKARRSGNGTSLELTDEDVTALQSGDKRTVLEVAKKIASAAKDSIESEMAPIINSTRQSLSEIEADRLFDEASKEYGEEFEKANDEGLLDEFLEKGFDPATAFEKLKYKELKSMTGEKLQSEARKILDQKKSGAVDTVGTTQVKGTKIIKAKNFDDAFEQAFAAAMEGHTDLKFEKK